MSVDQIFTYLNSSDFAHFLDHQAAVFVLLALGLALVALLLELRLPVKAYWGLPTHIARQTLRRLHLQPAPPVWGTCFNQDTQQPLSLVAVELLAVKDQSVLQRTYSDYQGQYGFKLKPGRYLVKATKNNYTQPSFLNPESIEVHSYDSSFVAEVTVLNDRTPPLVDLGMASQQSTTSHSWANTFKAVLQMLFFQLGHILIVLSAIISLLAVWLQPDWFYVIVLAVCLLLLFIKLYILRMIGLLSSSTQATARLGGTTSPQSSKS